MKPSIRPGSAHQQGYYTPRNPKKYRGDLTKIRFMSSWELSVHKFLDNNPNILEWSSEGIVIPYIKPTDGKVHKYYVDYFVKYKTSNGTVISEIWEVKPEAQCKPPKKGSRKKKSTLLHEQLTHAINIAKWQSATLFAKQHGLKFRLITEKQIFK